MASVVAERPTMPDLFPLPKIACKLTNGYYLWQCDYELRRNHEFPVMNKALDKDTPVSYHFISSAVATHWFTCPQRRPPPDKVVKRKHSNTWSEFAQSWQLTSLANQNKALFCENVYFYNPEFGNVLNLVTSVNCVVFLVGAIQIS